MLSHSGGRDLAVGMAINTRSAVQLRLCRLSLESSNWHHRDRSSPWLKRPLLAVVPQQISAFGRNCIVARLSENLLADGNKKLHLLFIYVQMSTQRYRRAEGSH